VGGEGGKKRPRRTSQEGRQSSSLKEGRGTNTNLLYIGQELGVGGEGGREGGREKEITYLPAAPAEQQLE